MDNNIDSSRLSQQVFFLPVFGLRIGKILNKEIQIERVIFIESEKIPRIRKRLGVKHPISKYRTRLHRNQLLNFSNVYACLKTKRDLNSTDYSRELKTVSDAFYILSSSFFSYQWRKDAALSLRPHSKDSKVRDILILDREFGRYRAGLYAVPPFNDNHINQDWKELNESFYFFDLLKILDGKVSIKKSWMKLIKRAAILAGQSYLARNVAEAFFFNMIAIETLLTEPGDTFPNSLIDRIVALFGWITNEDPSEWKKSIERLYSLRCSFVHSGKSGEITPMDLFEADTLLKNLLTNICKNARKFQSKKDIIRLTEILHDRKTLGLKPIRNIGTTYLNTSISNHKKKIINDTASWTW